MISGCRSALLVVSSWHAFRFLMLRTCNIAQITLWLTNISTIRLPFTASLMFVFLLFCFSESYVSNDLTPMSPRSDFHVSAAAVLNDIRKKKS